MISFSHKFLSGKVVSSYDLRDSREIAQLLNLRAQKKFTFGAFLYTKLACCFRANSTSRLIIIITCSAQEVEKKAKKGKKRAISFYLRSKETHKRRNFKLVHNFNKN